MKKTVKAEETVIIWLMRLAAAFIGIILLLIIASILYRGLPVLSWELLSQVPKGGYYYGRHGGFLNAIVGSLYLSFGATFLALMVGLPTALFLNVYARRKKRFVNAIRFFLDLMWGVPSIVYGAFGFSIMIYIGMKTSLLAGIITVALFILPIMIRAMDEIFRTVPAGLFESSLALGSNRSQVAYKIFLRQCIPGVITALLLSFGRAIGDAASVLFTAGYTDHIPTSLNKPVATLPLAIFFQLNSPIIEVQNRAFAAAVVLMFIVLVISILARILSKRFEKHRIKF